MVDDGHSGGYGVGMSTDFTYESFYTIASMTSQSGTRAHFRKNVHTCLNTL